MSIPYLNVAKAVALRANQLRGGNASARVSAYGYSTVSAFTSALDGVDVPYQALKQDILAQEAIIASMIGNSTNPIFRAALAGQSSVLVSSPVSIPAAGVSAPFVGALDGFYDQGDNTPLTEGDKREIDRFTKNPGSFWVVPKYQYHVEGRTLYHTRTSVVAKGCVWDRTVQAAAYDADGSSPLPQEMESLWVARVLANLPQEDWFVAEAGLYSQLAMKYEQELFEGKVAKMTIPSMPETTSRVDPAKD